MTITLSLMHERVRNSGQIFRQSVDWKAKYEKDCCKAKGRLLLCDLTEVPDD
jgi:hypothetical protein